METVIFATGNQHKIREVNEILKAQIKVVSHLEFGISDQLPEPFDNMHQNAESKAQYVYERVGIACFAEDSGLEVDALDMRPGVYSARYAGEHRVPDDNINKVLDELHGKQDRSAQFRSVIAYINEDQVYYFEGVVRGTILHERKGKGGFGYDPVFVPEGYDKSFAELPSSTKAKISHRAKSMNKLIDWLLTNSSK